VAKAATPFFLLLLLALAIIVFVPEIVTFLPNNM
jgi:TRAP-type C4-dicarboxylate transport system permease large subunit